MPNRFLSIEDLADMPEPAWLIDGMFEQNSLVMLAGPSYSFKSFLAIDWTLSLASGRSWNGRSARRARALYVLGEGKASLLKRLRAWMLFHHITKQEQELIEQNFRVSFEVPQMASKGSVDKMLNQLIEEKFEPSVIIIDTFARSFVGLDENSQKDVGLWVESADRLRQAGYTVIFLHHTAKNTEFGLKYRGSTAIMGAMDTAFTMQRDQDIDTMAVLTCTKQKDHDEGKPLYFQRALVKVTDAVTSMVLTPTVGAIEQKHQEQARVNRIIDGYLDDPTFTSERHRAEHLAKTLGITLAAAQSRVNRRSKERELHG